MYEDIANAALLEAIKDYKIALIYLRKKLMHISWIF